MDATRFDTMSRLLAGRFSRRTAVRHGAAGLAASALAVAGARGGVAAQEATPAAGGTTAEFLFVQSFEQGTLAPGASAGAYTLTLSHGLGQTIYFADRPSREVGAVPTAAFFADANGNPFDPSDPPNAALVMQDAAGETSVAVLELSNPRYDQSTHTATYDASLLADESALGLTVHHDAADAASLPESFGAASLFIDSSPKPDAVWCGFDTWQCFVGGDPNSGKYVGTLGYWQTCWAGLSNCTAQCQDYNAACNQTFAACNGECQAWIN